MAFRDLVAELVGVLPGLSPLLAQKYVNRAWEQIRDERLWNFLITDGVVICPVQITDGAVAITQFNASVTLNAAASAAIAPQIAGGAVPGITNLQIRFGTTSPGAGQIYNIIAFNAAVPTAVVLTLDRVVVEPTAAASLYQLYRAYVTPPVADFLMWESLADFANAFALTKTNGRLGYTSAYFDARDPQRQAQGLAYFLGHYLGARTVGSAVSPNPNVPAGSSIFELWPHATSGQTFYARFRRRGTAFSAQVDVQPTAISNALIIKRALYEHAYPFAKANAAQFPTFRGVSWDTLILTARADYQKYLRDTKRQDDEQAPNVWNRGHGLRVGAADYKGMNAYPIDANFLQSHLIRF